MSDSDTALASMSWNEIKYKNWIFTDTEDTLVNGSATSATDLTDAQISADSITASVKCADSSIRTFHLNDPLIYSHRGTQRGTYYLQSVDRIGPDRYQLYGLSVVGLLTQRPHAGGIYTGQTAEEVIRDICGSIPVLVESVYAKIRLYGWLPYVKPPQNSARDNLAQVLFALGAYLGTDLNGVLRVEKLWDGTVSIMDEDRLYMENASVRYDAAVSTVKVTEHQWVKSGEDVSLFDGTAEEGTLVTFSEPAYDLVGNGVTVRESGANYAILSAGTGTLTGKSYKHLTRIIAQSVSEDAVENEISVTDMTLVSLTNSVAVAKRLAQYYRSTVTIKSSVVTRKERPGHVAQIYDPNDKQLVPACIQSLDTTMSATLKSSMEALVGFTPAQPESAEYLDERVVLTGSGEFQIPEGTTTIHYVMISAGQGGRCGEKGEDTQSGPKFSWTNPVFEDRVDGYALALGGKGGPGGKGGMGGRIVEGDLDVSQLKSLAYACGKSGKGAEFSPDDLPGTDGTDTVFHGMTTAGASAPDWGFTDPITGEQFGGIGEDGLPGGDGAGRDPAVSEYTDDSVQKYVNGTIAYDEDGNAFTPGPVAGSDGKVSMTRITSTSTPRSYGWYSSGLGGGPAAGANGKAGSSGRGLPGETTVDVTGGPGADGMTATLTPSKPRRYGRGGRGGYGGGGAGSGGIAVKNGNGTITPGTPGSGGLGSSGGPSADGCVILYYRKFGQAKAGPLFQRGGGLFFDRLNKLFIV